MPNNITVKRLLVSGLVFFITAVGSVWAWWSYDKRVSEELEAQVELLGENTRSRIWSTINSEIDQLKSFTNRIEFTQGKFLNYWRKDAEQLVDYDKAILFMEWIDSNMIIRDVVPRSSNADIVNLDLRNVNYRVNAWKNNSMRDVINVTPWVTLIQGEIGRAHV